jgi:site-specific DNA recombinase
MAANPIKPVRCAIYTRKSTEHGLELEFNSLDAQRDSCEAYIKSQASQGWKALPQHYDDPAYSGGNLDRPALQQLLRDIDAGRIDVIVVYKIDRLTRSLADFAKLVEAFDAKSISFVAVTQQFNTTTSMGRLTLNVLLSFAQFERELSSERVRDKVAASRRKGKWTGGTVPLGYDARDKKLIINKAEAETSAISSSGISNCRVLGSWWRISTTEASSRSAAIPKSRNSMAEFPSRTVPSPTS